VHITRQTVIRFFGIASLGGSWVLAQAAGTDVAAESADSSGASPDGLQEIVVTAEKRAERLNEVPLSVTAATGNQLQELGVSSPAGLEKIVPGFVFTQSAYAAPVYTIRGIGSYDEAIAISPAVGVYVDQVPLPFSRMTSGASFDLSRVEVLKGPQGTLFGQNSTGGAVNYIANRPTADLAAGGQITYGRFDETDIETFVGETSPTGFTQRSRSASRKPSPVRWACRSPTESRSAPSCDDEPDRVDIHMEPSH
jgi:iron complex outermembrane receptor protein